MSNTIKISCNGEILTACFADDLGKDFRKYHRPEDGVLAMRFTKEGINTPILVRWELKYKTPKSLECNTISCPLEREYLVVASFLAGYITKDKALNTLHILNQKKAILENSKIITEETKKVEEPETIEETVPCNNNALLAAKLLQEAAELKIRAAELLLGSTIATNEDSSQVLATKEEPKKEEPQEVVVVKKFGRRSR